MNRTRHLLKLSFKKHEHFSRFFGKMDVVLYTLYLAILPKCRH